MQEKNKKNVIKFLTGLQVFPLVLNFYLVFHNQENHASIHLILAQERECQKEELALSTYEEHSSKKNVVFEFGGTIIVG